VNRIHRVHVAQRVGGVASHPAATMAHLRGGLLELCLLMMVGAELEDVKHGSQVPLVVFAGDDRFSEELGSLFGHTL
jgi:hypothetical protein